LEGASNTVPWVERKPSLIWRGWGDAENMHTHVKPREVILEALNVPAFTQYFQVCKHALTASWMVAVRAASPRSDTTSHLWRLQEQRIVVSFFSVVFFSSLFCFIPDFFYKKETHNGVLCLIFDIAMTRWTRHHFL
jgi:hypothetical protein